MIRSFTNIIINNLLRSSWRSVVLLWKPMALWTLIVYIIFSAILAPLLLSFLDWSFLRGDRLVIGNEDLLAFFLSPTGFFYLFMLSLVFIFGIILRFAGLFDIVSDNLMEKPISIRQTAIHTIQRIHKLFKIGTVTLLVFFLFLIPLIGGLAFIYNLYLGEFSLSNYLETTPPEWYRALTYGAIWFTAWLIFFLVTLACALPALPAYLERNLTLRKSLHKVWDMPFKRTLLFLKSVFLVGILWFFIRIISDATLLTIFMYLSEWGQTKGFSLRTLAFIAGGYLFSGFIMAGIISFIGFSFISSIVTKFYYSHTQPSIIPTSPSLLNLTQKTLQIIFRWTGTARTIFLLLFFVIGSTITSLIITSSNNDYTDTLVIAHRANTGNAPENSILALQNTISTGADFVEIDVQLTADATPVLFHDEDLFRMTGQSGRILDYNFDELQQFPLINHHSEPIHIPDLRTFLKQADNHISVIIELKYYGFNTALAPKVVELVKELQMEDQVRIKSLNISAISQLQQISPDLTIGYVSAVVIGDLNQLPIHFLSVNHTSITPQLVTTYHNHGITVYGWTVNNRDDMIDLILKNVNGIITDRPDMAISILNEMSKLTAAEKLLLHLGLLILEESENIIGSSNGVTVSFPD